MKNKVLIIGIIVLIVAIIVFLTGSKQTRNLTQSPSNDNCPNCHRRRSTQDEFCHSCGLRLK